MRLEIIKKKYEHLCMEISDINEHLPVIFDYAQRCESIFETGVRGVVSSWALSYGLLCNGSKNKRIFFNDIVKCDIEELKYNLDQLDVNVSYEWINNLHLNLNQTFDLTFIDTWHVYGQLKRELEKFAPITNKYIIMHDTTGDEEFGECIRMPNEIPILNQSILSGIPVNEILKGLGPAIEEFLEKNKNWILKEKFLNNNGLTILERIQ
jgi:hypothetical protein